MTGCVTTKYLEDGTQLPKQGDVITTYHHRSPPGAGVPRTGGGAEWWRGRGERCLRQCRGSRLRVSSSRAAHWATREETSHRDNISCGPGH